MQTGIRTILLLSLLTLLAASALAEVTITTDKIAYLTGEIVQITIQNTGPFDTAFNSDPLIQLHNMDTSECLFGCVGLAVMTPFPAGSTEVINHDTGQYSDPVGNYRVYVNITGLPVFTDYAVTGEVGTEAMSWGTIKALYRD